MSSVEESYSKTENLESLDERVLVLKQCISKLTQKEQKLIMERYAGEVSMETYAEQMEMSYGCLRVAIYRIKRKLRNCIEKRSSLKGGAV